MRRTKKYRLIRFELAYSGFVAEDIGELLGRCRDYVLVRLRGGNGKSFMIEDAYKILDMLGLPKEDIFKYFPPGGIEAEKPRISASREVVGEV
ncbi:MAG: hypothetical protein IJD36_02305 [Clostridia bacterium]|nr:hypothetical protein [Clostridia bacterium]